VESTSEATNRAKANITLPQDGILEDACPGMPGQHLPLAIIELNFQLWHRLQPSSCYQQTIGFSYPVIQELPFSKLIKIALLKLKFS
jgi:hypothetical protein